jgi:hypothetical protein
MFEMMLILLIVALLALHKMRPIRITYYYRPTCPYCVQARPKIDAFKAKLKPCVKFIEVDTSAVSVPHIDRVPMLCYDGKKYGVHQLDQLLKVLP